ncbi:hypothetical protein C8J57DRAFT_1235161 [Mycena rebaudengoi]|nr:hypothetical protein C8J57DRAFT_1235161 [Mycena rebaudengoi]
MWWLANLYLPNLSKVRSGVMVGGRIWVKRVRCVRSDVSEHVVPRGRQPRYGQGSSHVPVVKPGVTLGVMGFESQQLAHVGAPQRVREHGSIYVIESRGMQGISSMGQNSNCTAPMGVNVCGKSTGSGSLTQDMWYYQSDGQLRRDLNLKFVIWRLQVGTLNALQESHIKSFSSGEELALTSKFCDGDINHFSRYLEFRNWVVSTEMITRTASSQFFLAPIFHRNIIHRLIGEVKSWGALGSTVTGHVEDKHTTTACHFFLRAWCIILIVVPCITAGYPVYGTLWFFKVDG